MKEEKKKRGAGKKKHARSPKMTRHSKVAMDETETETEDRRFSEWSSSSNWGSRAFVLSSPDPLTPVREGDYVYVLTQPFVGFGNCKSGQGLATALPPLMPPTEQGRGKH